MVKRMLIDATHAEETRVVVLNGTRPEEFDVETSTKRQLKGNIYLAKVIRVEPSLQAAFVDYGGNRHGFLSFNEIHPDYYQIPVSDRQALKAQHQEVMQRSAVVADFSDSTSDELAHAEETASSESPAEGQDHEGQDHQDHQDQSSDAAPAEAAEPTTAEMLPAETGPEEAAPADANAETDDFDESAPPRRPKSLRHYKIQEVIKRRQILLVQVVKEERGTKGAALTTYLSLAGRYCVLMPNTARGGGVSRKITNPADRKRLKVIANELEIPEGMAVIVRTAGSERTKPEIKRDYEYLLRLWDSVRELTLQSTAPKLVYEEANLIKRSIRDLYSRDIDEIQVDGEEGYRLAKEFMRMLTPSHAKRVQLYKDPAMPLFHRYQVEAQLDAMLSPVVQLKSGGYLVFNQTEALVAIDVNSGRATRERHIEETALKTNLEAADEIARHLRLRDLAGLVVIDFIDMEDSRNNHAVERRFKEAMRFDRARVQLGRISSFGLFELSRQRLRPSLMESSFQTCAHCAGFGMIRSTESSAVHVIRAIEEEGIRLRSREVTVTVNPEVALYVLNHKRKTLAEIESRYGLSAVLLGDATLIPPAFRLERTNTEAPILPERPAAPAVIEAPDDADDIGESEDEADIEIEAEDESSAAEPQGPRPAESSEDGAVRRRRRRRRRGRREDGAGQPHDGASAAPREQSEATGEESEAHESAPGGAVAPVFAEGDESQRRRRRGKRGGRRRHRGRDGAQGSIEGEGFAPPSDVAPGYVEGETVQDDLPAVSSEPFGPELASEADMSGESDAVEPAGLAAKPARTRAPRKPAADGDFVPRAPRRPRGAAARKDAGDAETASPAPMAEDVTATEPEAYVVAEPPPEPLPEPKPQTMPEPEPALADVPAGPPRKGWWNKIVG
jgi:ribonuclease E